MTRETRHHGEAETVEVLEPDPRRRAPPCPHAIECGGCDFQHAERSVQIEMKRSIVIDAFRRIGRLEVEHLLEGPHAAGDELGARNRIRLTYDAEGRPGLLRRGSHEVVPIEDCLLMDRRFGTGVLPWLRALRGWRKATVRFDSGAGAVVLLESGERAGSPARRAAIRSSQRLGRPPAVRGVLADGARLGGERALRFRVAGTTLRADATSFFQVNLAATDELVRVVGGFLGDAREGTLIDLYAGVGLFAVCLGKGFAAVAASESDRRTARYLRRNLREAGLPAEARAEPAEVTLRELPRAEHETVIVDPPRAGLAPAVRRRLVARRPERIVSVSCDPATGARDAARLVEAGWQLERIAAVDLFPVTAHVETVSLLTR